MEGKKIGQKQERISRRRLVLNPTIQQVVINLHIKYEHSTLHGYWEIFDEKCHSSKYGRKENWTKTGKNKQEKTGSTIQQVVINLHTKYEPSSLHGYWEIFDKKCHSSKYGRKENWTNTGTNKQEKSHHQPAYQIWTFYLAWLLRNLWRKMSFFKVWKERQELSSDSIARLKRRLFKVKKSFWQSFMKTGSKLCLLDSTHGFSKNWPNGLVFDPTWPILNSGLDLITTYIQTQFHENWIKTMPSREYTWFF